MSVACIIKSVQIFSEECMGYSLCNLYKRRDNAEILGK
jgi:hypothetical protein